MKYPNLAVGALAASAPIWQMISDCDSFAHVNTYAFQKADPVCPSIIKQSWSLMDSTSLSDLTKIFHLCKPLESVDSLKDWLIDIYGNIAMANYPYPTSFLGNLPANPVSVMCANITTNAKNESNSFDVLNAIYKGANVFLNYTGSEKCFSVDDDTPSDLGLDAWSYQTCTEFVFPTCSNGNTDMFELTKWDLQAYIKQCYAQFQVKPRLEWPQIQFGGHNIKAHTNIIFSNGDIDPWSGGGVLVNLTSSLPAIIIQNGAHHLDLRASNPNDPKSVIQARLFHMQKIEEWILNFKKQF
jgi:lysosomal Pro-X carboxypeptidase